MPARSAGRRAEAVLILLAAALVAGCQSQQAAMPAVEPAPPASPARDELVELLRYGNEVRELDAWQLEEQYRQLALGEGGFLSGDSVIRMSLLLSTPNAPFHDIDQATRFLRAVIERRFAEPGQIDLAKLLYHLLSERVYAASEDENLAMLLSEARDVNERLTEELEVVRAELAAERERRKTLQGQLEALKKLEEQLSLESIERP